MPLRNAIAGLRAYLKRGEAMPRYFVPGKGEVRLSTADFKGRGGEGAVYVKGSTAYKIYSDPRRAIPPEKIKELSVLAQPNIIRPLDALLDEQHRPAGYAMRRVGPSYALCQLFPKTFRQRNNLTPDAVLRLVRRLQEGVGHVHSKGILIVDLNELNFLVSEDLREIFFIDVDSYQTPSFPASVLMESVRDRHAREFTAASDWFSFAVISFQMFVGIHPFKGTYPPLQNLPDKESKLDARMRANVSVLRAGVSVPGSCLPFSVIPTAYLEWYRAVFEESRRLPPPDAVQPALTLAQASAPARPESSHFELTELQEFDGDILWHDGAITITQQSIYYGGKQYPRPPFDLRVTTTARLRHLVAAYMEGGKLRFDNLTLGRRLDSGVEGEEVMLAGGQFYVRQRETIFAAALVELPRNSLLGIKPAANVMMKSTRMFDGLAVQNLLGAYYASVFPAPGVCHQVRLPELDNYQLVDAKLSRNVLLVVGAKEGRYDKLIFRFAEDFGGHDFRVAPDVASTNIDFTVLDSGVVLHMTDEDCLEVFPRAAGSSELKVIRDAAVRGGVRLFHTGSQALVARGNKLYRLRMRREPAGSDTR